MDINDRAGELATAFGHMVRTERKARGLRQSQLALAAGVSRDFLIGLERGKATTELGRSLLVAQAVGLSLDRLLSPAVPTPADGLPEPEEEDEDDVASPAPF